MAHAQKPDFVFRAKRTSPFKSAEGGWASVQSTTGSRGVRISGSNAGYTMFRASVKGTGYPLHSPVSPSLPLPCVTVFRHISTGLYYNKFTYMYLQFFFLFLTTNHQCMVTNHLKSPVVVCSNAKPIYKQIYCLWLTSASILRTSVGRDSSVCIATRYGMEGREIESRRRQDFPHPSRPTLETTQPPIQRILGLFPGGKAAGAWRRPPTPHLAPRLKERLGL